MTNLGHVSARSMFGGHSGHHWPSVNLQLIFQELFSQLESASIVWAEKTCKDLIHAFHAVVPMFLQGLFTKNGWNVSHKFFSTSRVVCKMYVVNLLHFNSRLGNPRVVVPHCITGSSVIVL